MFLSFFVNNLITIPIIFFISGILFARFNIFSNSKFNSFVIFFLLFSIGLKGGGSLIDYSNSRDLFIIICLMVWGVIQPFISYLILRALTKVDRATLAAIAACFGSVSVMTYAAGVAFLEKLGIQYDGFVVVALAIMEVPAIISGLFLSKTSNNTNDSLRHLLLESIFNKTILIIVLGMAVGAVCSLIEQEVISLTILIAFKPFLCLFLFKMGTLVRKHKSSFQQFPFSLILFGLGMPVMGAAFGIYLSYSFDLNVGTGTLIAILTASASYIAVPAAMRIALPEAKESIYLPLSLGITFPFNVMIGIPIYYNMAAKFLS